MNWPSAQPVTVPEPGRSPLMDCLEGLISYQEACRRLALLDQAKRELAKLEEEAREHSGLEECWNCGSWVEPLREVCPFCGVEEPPF
jgi:hypothetical protein